MNIWRFLIESTREAVRAAGGVFKRKRIEFAEGRYLEAVERAASALVH
jgi:hypothetical protein